MSNWKLDPDHTQAEFSAKHSGDDDRAGQLLPPADTADGAGRSAPQLCPHGWTPIRTRAGAETRGSLITVKVLAG
jgi:hypothetical protein